MDEHDPYNDPSIAELLKAHEREVLGKVFDDAINRWLDKKFAEVGRWSLRGIMATVFGGLVWFYLHTGGFK